MVFSIKYYLLSFAKRLLENDHHSKSWTNDHFLIAFILSDVIES